MRMGGIDLGFASNGRRVAIARQNVQSLYGNPMANHIYAKLSYNTKKLQLQISK